MEKELRFLIKLICFIFLLIISFHLLSLEQDENFKIMTGSFHGYEIESVIPDYKIEFNFSRSNFGNVFDHNGKHLKISKTIHNNFDIVVSHEISKNIGLSSIFSNIYSNRKFKFKTLDLELYGKHFKFGFSYDFLIRNQNWSTDVTETDGFIQVYFQYYNNFQISKILKNRYSVGYRQIFQDEYKEVNDIDIVMISKFNNRSVLYISNKAFTAFRLIDLGVELFYNHYRRIRINSDNSIGRTNGYIFSISPYLILKFPTKGFFLEISSVSKYENVKFGYPIVGKNTLAPTSSVQINLIKEWDN